MTLSGCTVRGVLDDEVKTAGQVLQQLPDSIRGDFEWCPARKAIGHDYTARDPETFDVATMQGTVRTYTVRTCRCGQQTTRDP